jgi:hypothetical protein
MIFTLQQGKRYKVTLNLGFVERIASNDVIADKFRTAGFADVDVHGEGSTRYAEGVWSKEDLKPTYPAQVSDVSEVVT